MTTANHTRGSFTDDFKREAVSLLASSGRPLIKVPAELGIQPSMFRIWLGLADGAAGSSIESILLATKTVPSADQLEIRRLRREFERAQKERDALKKPSVSSWGPARVRFCFIEDHWRAYPVRLMCAALEVNARYAWCGRPERARVVADRNQPSESVTCMPITAPSMAVRACKRYIVFRVGVNRVARLMRDHGIQGQSRRQAPCTIQRRHALPLAQIC